MLYNIVKAMRKYLTKKAVVRSALVTLGFLAIAIGYMFATVLVKTMLIMSLKEKEYNYILELWPLPMFYIGMIYHWFANKYMTGRFIRDGK